jgi:hypothetical protein
MPDVHAHEHATMLKRAFKDCGNITVCNQPSRGADRFVQSTGTIDLDAARKQLSCKQSNLSPLFDPSFAQSSSSAASSGSRTCQYNLLRHWQPAMKLDLEMFIGLRFSFAHHLTVFQGPAYDIEQFPTQERRMQISKRAITNCRVKQGKITRPAFNDERHFREFFLCSFK